MENDADKFDFVRPLAAENDPVVPAGNGIAAADIVPVKGTDKRESIPVKQAIDIDAPKRERGGIREHALDFLKKMGVAFSIASALASSPSVDRFHRDMNVPARRNHAGDEEAWENVRFGRRKQEVEDSSDGLQQAIPHYDKGGQVDRSSQAGSDSGVFRKIKSISDRIGSGVKTAAGATSKAVKKTATIFSIASALSGWGDLSPVAASVAAASDSTIPREVQIGSHWLDHDRRRKAVESKDNPKVVGKAGESVDDLVMHYEKGGQVTPDSDSGVFQKIKSISGSLGSGVKSAAETASKAVKKTATAFSIVSALSGWGDISSVAASASASADSSTPREVAIATHWLGHDRRRKSAETKESPKASGKAADGIDDSVDHYDKGGPVVADLVPAKSRTAESADPVSDGGTDGGFQNDAHRDWFGDSKITDESGSPLTLHHGTTSDFDVFDTSRSQLGSHFGTRGQAEGFAKGKDNGKVHDVTLRMENPLRLRDHGRWYWPDVTQELKEKGIEVPDELEKEYQAVTKENLFERAFRGITGAQLPSKKRAIAKWTTKNLQDVIKKSGHDGVVYRNDFEGLDTAKFQEARKERGFQYGSQEYEDALKEFGASDSYIAFDPTQIKSRKNVGTFNPDDPSIHREDGGEIPIHPDVPADADEVPIKAKAGEFVVRKEQAQKFKPLLEAINDDDVQPSAAGAAADGVDHFERGGEVYPAPVAMMAGEDDRPKIGHGGPSYREVAPAQSGTGSGGGFDDWFGGDVDHFKLGGEVGEPKPKIKQQHAATVKSFFDFESDTEHLPPRVREKAYAHYVAQQAERESLTPDFAKKEFRENKPEDITQYRHASKEREAGFHEAREKWGEQKEERWYDQITQRFERENPEAFDNIIAAVKRNELSTSDIIHQHVPEEFRGESSSGWISHLRTSSRKSQADAQDDEQPLAESNKLAPVSAAFDVDLPRRESPAVDPDGVPSHTERSKPSVASAEVAASSSPTPSRTDKPNASREAAERESSALRTARGMADSGYSVSVETPAKSRSNAVAEVSAEPSPLASRTVSDNENPASIQAATGQAATNPAPRGAIEEPRRGTISEPPAQSGENPSLSTDVKPAALSLTPPEAAPAKAQIVEPADDWRAEWKRANAARAPVQEQGGASQGGESFADLQKKRESERIAAMYAEAAARREAKRTERPIAGDADTFHKATPQQSENINSHIAKGESVVGDVFGHSEPEPKKSPARGGGGYDSPKKPGGDDAAAKAERDSTIARLNKSREAERDAENKQRVFDTKRAIAKESGAVDFDDHFESVRGELNKVIDDVGQQPPLATGKRRYFHGGQKIDAGDDHMFDVFTPSVEEASYAAMLAEKPVSYVDLDEEKAQHITRNYHADPSVTQSSAVLFDTFDGKRKQEDDTPVARSRFTPTTPQEPLPSRGGKPKSVSEMSDDELAELFGISFGTPDDEIPTALRADGIQGDSAPFATEAKPTAKKEASPRARRKGRRAATSDEPVPQRQAPGEKAKSKATATNKPEPSETDRLSWKMNQRFDLSQMLQAGAYATDLLGGKSSAKGPTGWGSTKEDGDFYQAVYGKSMPRNEDRGLLSGASDYLRKGAALTSGGGMDWMFGEVGSKGMDGMLGGVSSAMRGVLGGGEDDPKPGGEKGGGDGDGKMVGKIATTAAKFAFPEAAPLIAMAEKTGIVDKLFSSEGGGGMFGGGLGGALSGLLGGGDGKDGADGKDESGGGEVAKLLRELIDVIKGQGKAGEQPTGYGNTQSHPSLNLSIPGLINAIGLMANAPRG